MVRGCVSAWYERADMAGAPVPGVDREGLGGSKHAGVTGWHVEIDYGRVCDGSVDLWAM